MTHRKSDATEIEITPEMIAAGRRELASVDYRLTDADEAVMRVVESTLAAGGYDLRLARCTSLSS